LLISYGKGNTKLAGWVMGGGNTYTRTWCRLKQQQHLQWYNTDEKGGRGKNRRERDMRERKKKERKRFTSDRREGIVKVKYI